MIVHLEGVFNGLWRDFSMFHSWKFQMRSRMVATLLPPNASTSYLARVYKKAFIGHCNGAVLDDLWPTKQRDTSVVRGKRSERSRDSFYLQHGFAQRHTLLCNHISNA